MARKKQDWNYLTEAYEESIAISRFKENPDGSITVQAQIELSLPEPNGKVFVTNRTLRLKVDK